MEKSSRVIAVVALCVAVVGLTLGFAAFSNTLTIESSANVKPDASTFNVDFSSSESALETNPVTAVTEPGGLTTGPATISNVGAPTISGLSVEFTEPGQKATYTFYARNEGEFTAFLKSINYANAEGGSAPRKCTATGGASEDLVLAACEDITLSVKVGSESAVTGTNASITGHTLNKDASEKIVVEIEYAADGTRADGEFSVEFGDVSLTYSSVD